MAVVRAITHLIPHYLPGFLSRSAPSRDRPCDTLDSAMACSSSDPMGRWTVEEVSFDVAEVFCFTLAYLCVLSAFLAQFYLLMLQWNLTRPGQGRNRATTLAEESFNFLRLQTTI